MSGRFNVEYHPGAPPAERYSAVEDATYDGAPDSGRRSRLMGWGATPDEAIDDWFEQWRELEEDWPSEPPELWSNEP